MRDKGQVLMFNDAELGLIKAVFCDNDDGLYILRKALLQFPMDESEKNYLKGIMTPELYAVIKKRIFPELDADAPFGQVGDIYQTLTNDIRTKTVEEMAELFEAKQLEIEYLAQQFEFLKDVSAKFEPKIKLDELASLAGMNQSLSMGERMTNARRYYVNTIARNFLISFIEQNLIMLKSLAGEKKESIEDAKKRLTRDSAK